MDARIVFPQTDVFDWDRECVVFPAVVNGRRVACFASSELLMLRFGPHGLTANGRREVVPTFRAHRRAVEAVARRLIAEGRCRDGRLVLLPEDAN